MSVAASVARFLTPREREGPGVVAVSGGPDSVALAHALLVEVGPARLCVAHVNHALRGPASDADEAFVATLACGWRVRFWSTRVDVAAAARASRANLEATARRLRYARLADAALALGARWVATGHTADDQAETVLQRLLRGTGVTGLAGIAERRELASGVVLVRPLLSATRADVLAHLTEAGIEARDDASNADPRFLRNRLRHELLPQLTREYGPGVAASLARLAENAAEARAGIDERATELLAAWEAPRAGAAVVLRRDGPEGASDFWVAETLRRLWSREGWPIADMSREHWRRAVAVARGTLPRCEFPAGVVAVASAHASRWERR